MTGMPEPLRLGGTLRDMGGTMGDADELRIMAETLGPMNKHLSSRLLEIAARVEARDAALTHYGRPLDEPDSARELMLGEG